MLQSLNTAAHLQIYQHNTVGQRQDILIKLYQKELRQLLGYGIYMIMLMILTFNKDPQGLIARKVFSSNLAHLSLVFFWISGMHLHGAYLSNYDIWLKIPNPSRHHHI